MLIDFAHYHPNYTDAAMHFLNCSSAASCAPPHHRKNSMFCAFIFFWSLDVFFQTPLVLRQSIYRSCFVACCRTGPGYVCLQLCPIVLLSLAQRILTWNSGINAGPWNRQAVRLTSSGCKWTPFKQNGHRRWRKNASPDRLTIQSSSFRCTWTERFCCPCFLEVFTHMRVSVYCCGIVRLTCAILVCAGGPSLVLSARERRRGNMGKRRNCRCNKENCLKRSPPALAAWNLATQSTMPPVLHAWDGVSGQFWLKMRWL